MPEFPDEMSARGKRGEVTVEFIINPRGIVTHLNVVGEPNPFFAAMVERAVSQWEFKPARKAGRPIAAFATQKVEFRY